MSEFVASSGKMVAAVLEGAGYVFQSYVLDTLSLSFQGEIGALIYAVALVAGLVNFALNGEYRLWRWFLLGPGLFLSVVLPRTEVPLPRWQWAGMERDSGGEIVRSGVEEIVESKLKDNTANVSSLFAHYTRLMSSVVSDIVIILNAGQPDADLKLIDGPQIVTALQSRVSQDPDFQELLHHALLRDCSDMIESARQLGDSRFSNDSNRSSLQSQFEQQSARRINLSSGAETFVAKQKLFYPSFWNRDFTSDLGAARELSLAEPERYGDAQVQSRIAETKTELSNIGAFSCKQVWNFALAGLVLEGREGMEEALSVAESKGISRESVLKDLQQIVVGKQLERGRASVTFDEITMVVAQKTLRNELDRGSRAAFLQDMAQRGRTFQTVEVQAESESSLMERIRIANKEWGERNRAIAIGSNIPYYQGVVLYFLSLTFPFFALLLLIPEKHQGFIQWFMLWMWVKSWDIGFAVVGIMGQLMYGMFAAGSGNANGHAISGDLAATFALLSHSDPTFQLSTYYTIIGTALSMIPAVSAQLIMGGMKGGAGLVAGAISSFGEGIGTAVGRTQQQLSVSQTRSELNHQIFDRAREYNKNLGAGKSQYGGAQGSADAATTGQISPGISGASLRPDLTGLKPFGTNALANNISQIRGIATTAQVLNAVTDSLGLASPKTQGGFTFQNGAGLLGRTVDSIARNNLSLVDSAQGVSETFASYDAQNSKDANLLKAKIGWIGGPEAAVTLENPYDSSLSHYQTQLSTQYKNAKIAVNAVVDASNIKGQSEKAYQNYSHDVDPNRTGPMKGGYQDGGMGYPDLPTGADVKGTIGAMTGAAATGALVAGADSLVDSGDVGSAAKSTVESVSGWLGTGYNAMSQAGSWIADKLGPSEAHAADEIPAHFLPGQKQEEDRFESSGQRAEVVREEVGESPEEVARKKRQIEAERERIKRRMEELMKKLAKARASRNASQAADLEVRIARLIGKDIELEGDEDDAEDVDNDLGEEEDQAMLYGKRESRRQRHSIKAS